MTVLDDLPIHERPVTASLAASRLHCSVRTIQRWASAGHLPAAACIVENRQEVYWELDVMLAESKARAKDTRSPRRVA